jgi:hypothetical protein
MGWRALHATPWSMIGYARYAVKRIRHRFALPWSASAGIG